MDEKKMLINREALNQILGITEQVSLTIEEMIKDLRITVFPASSSNANTQKFMDEIISCFIHLGTEVIPWDKALTQGKRGKKISGKFVIFSHEIDIDKKLPVEFVSSLRDVTIVGILNKECPAQSKKTMQDKLNAVVHHLSWNIFQIAIFITPQSSTTCTMNGAIVVNKISDINEMVIQTLLPKIAAPVIPPRMKDYDLHYDKFEPKTENNLVYINDFLACTSILKKTPLFLFHTPIDSLKFRNRFHKRIAKSYLDNRNGMSYGFLVRQLPVKQTQIMSINEAINKFEKSSWIQQGFIKSEGKLFVIVNFSSRQYVIEVPPVEIISTRSGCNKLNLNTETDLLLMRLNNGKISFDLPPNIHDNIQPSYDTLLMLSQAVGNAIIASICEYKHFSQEFVNYFRKNGFALLHWHDYIDAEMIPEGYTFFGINNLPVSCSTNQSAIFALSGKLNAFEDFYHQKKPYVGDVQIEPHHGVNITGKTLHNLAKYAFTLQ